MESEWEFVETRDRNGCWQARDFTFAPMGMIEERVHGRLSFGAAGGPAKHEGACTLYYIKEARNRFAPSWRTIFFGICVSSWYDDEFF